jgi:ABC-type transport system involved in Fe-S cluster assembly fused permease/ATPase subunit
MRTLQIKYRVKQRLAIVQRILKNSNIPKGKDG